MLMPKRVKRRKQFRGTMAGKAMRGNTITYGEYGLVALGRPAGSSPTRSKRPYRTDTLSQSVPVRFGSRCFPDKPVTAKPCMNSNGFR